MWTTWNQDIFNCFIPIQSEHLISLGWSQRWGLHITQELLLSMYHKSPLYNYKVVTRTTIFWACCHCSSALRAYSYTWSKLILVNFWQKSPACGLMTWESFMNLITGLGKPKMLHVRMTAEPSSRQAGCSPVISASIDRDKTDIGTEKEIIIHLWDHSKRIYYTWHCHIDANCLRSTQMTEHSSVLPRCGQGRVQNDESVRVR